MFHVLHCFLRSSSNLTEEVDILIGARDDHNHDPPRHSGHVEHLMMVDNADAGGEINDSLESNG